MARSERQPANKQNGHQYPKLYACPHTYTLLPGISDFSFTFAHKHTPVALLWQAHIAMAAIGGNPAGKSTWRAYSGKFMQRLVQPQGEISVTLALEKFHLLGR